MPSSTKHSGRAPLSIAMSGMVAVLVSCSYDFDQFRAVGAPGSAVAGASGAAASVDSAGASGHAAAGGGVGGAGAASAAGGVAGSFAGAAGVPAVAGAAGAGAAFDCSAVLGTVWNNHCYFQIAPGTGLVWDDAKSACEEFSPTAHLATITSAEEEAMIEQEFFPAITDLWIGLSLADTRTYPPPDHCAVEPERCPFSWVSGEPLSYTNWAAHSATDSEPNYSGSCVRIQMLTLRWADYRCDTREGQISALCEHEYEPNGDRAL